MAKPNEVTESSMEEILASIRKIISEDESKVAGAKSSSPMRAEEDPASNISHLFSDDRDEAEPSGGFARDALEHLQEVEAAGPEDEPAPAMDNSEKDDFKSRLDAAVTRGVRPVEAERLPATADTGGSLLSPRADAAVASAFSHLANSIFANNSRTVEQLAEEMMRPMLKDWLDENLPPMVERLVREEIERVSRRR